MALIPVTFKHSTDEDKKKSGKVSTITARMLYANTFSDKVGIVKGYKKDETTDELAVGYDNTATTSNTFRLVFSKGAVSIFGGVGIIEQGTIYDIPKGLSNYSFGIRIDLKQPAGDEMMFYHKPATESLLQQDLQIYDTDGVYEFELFKITTIGDAPVVSEKTPQFIQSVNDFLESKLKDLGFNEGNIAFTGGQVDFEGTVIASVSFSDIARNEFIRQGNFVIANFSLKFSAYSAGGSTISIPNAGSIPKEFIPKENIVFSVGTNTYITLRNDGGFSFQTEAGFGGYASGTIAKQHLGYQTNPIEQ